MNKILTIIFLLAYIPKSFACLCLNLWNEWDESEVREQFSYTDVIFIGELKSISLEEKCYEFEIINTFKGDLKKEEIVQGYYMNSCSAMPTLNGKYLIYGSYYNLDGKMILEYGQCSSSKWIEKIHTQELAIYFEKELEFLNRHFDTNVELEN
ncbi:hypothetical protein [Gilvibacter sp.]|uniref:hypothetical protein n=1 Tax=Gilvibacter sp. TaxID=2729997 RepID=UPI003F49E64D